MIICVDVGNTNICLGVYENKKIINRFRLATLINESSDEYGIKIKSLLMYNNIAIDKIEGVIIGSVVPAVDLTFEKMFREYFNITPLFVGQGIKSGVNIKIDNPKELGADLLIGAVGALAKYQSPAVIIDMGTAITFVYVNENKELLGGVICAGIKTSYRSLAANTSKLEDVKIADPKNIVGRNTISCIQNGMVYGTCGMIEGIISRMKEEYGDFKVILTGGDAQLIKDYLKIDVIYDSDLLFDGLVQLYYKNQSK